MTGTNRGFTLLEMATTVAIVAIVAALAVPVMRAARRNATVQSTGFELKVRLEGLRAVALRDQRDLLAVVVDAVQNRPTNCPPADCAALYVLAPAAGFALNAWNPKDPATFANAEHIDHSLLGRGMKLYLPAAGRQAPPPFTAVTAFDPELVGLCGPDRRCMAIRFRADGSVDAERADGTDGPQKLGAAFVIGSDADTESAGSDQRGVLVAFPSGLVKPYAVSR